MESKDHGTAHSLFEVEVETGGWEGPHVQHRGDECLCVVESLFGFLGEGEEIEAGPDSLVYVPMGTLHAFENLGETVCRLLVVHAPGGPHELFVKEAGEPVTTGDTSSKGEKPPVAGSWSRSRRSTA